MPRVRPHVFSLREFLLPSFYRDLFVEMLISSLLLLFITFSLTSISADLYRPSTTHIGLMVGFVIYLLIEGNGHLSGAHMNPVVTFAYCLDGRITCVRAFLYTVAQCIGGILGSAIVYGLSPTDVREAFHPFTPAPSIGVPQGLIIEIIFTFNLIYTAISTTDKKDHQMMLPSLPTAFCVGTAIMATIYWVADYTGALMGVIVYKVYTLVNRTPADSNTTDPRRPEEVALKNERMKEEISELLEKLINMASRKEPNDNSYQENKRRLSDVKSSEGGLLQ
ncbi:hypothetical protein LSH36_1120g00019 [Paralvinella palmiformis]|uniref:Aquaporin n=1 Tax=Paralvinella palmiformis TaxID=53620 RepID=A0AAD9IUQ0_9ANNE|nr:hypothetical protein LSH36_1120g00019 [Paralvinella palmiformis]